MGPKEHGNNTELYKKNVQDWTQIDLTRQVNSLSEEELEKLVNAIERKEGTGAGKIIEFPAPGNKKKILDVKKNKENLIIQYLIEGYGWLRKTEAINLVEKDIVDAVIVKRQNAYIFLRSRPDKTKINNLDK